MQRRARLALITGLALALGLTASARPHAPAGFLGRYLWTSDNPDFGGISGVEITENGLSLLAIIDQGKVLEADLRRDGDGRISGVTVTSLRPLEDGEGRPLRRPWPDAEGLDLAADGRWHVSFEGRDVRVLRYDSRDGPSTILPRAPAFSGFSTNEALEALAVDGSGQVHVVPESPDASGQGFTLFRLQGDHWDSRLSIPRRGAFRPVSADFGPDGRLYLLERAFTVFGGFSNRLRRFDPGDDLLANEVTLLQTQPGLHDNLEGLSVWRDPQGRLRATMVADDNFFPLQSGELVEYRLPD